MNGVFTQFGALLSIPQVLMPDPQIAVAARQIYEHLNLEFATIWPEYDLDARIRALLIYAKELTETPSLVGDPDIDALPQAGWDQKGIYGATALISFFNFSGRMEAASGLPMDKIPPEVSFPEATSDS
ncbi:MAG: hypothetical protein A2038_03570 [Deltaproteobacteria bacterium GWA2_57_13]|nr:MAG: hypothetical protein A2038_03570 [Deltaproteobacteria bacterium GWA2_57_13]OGQ80731.1 MAG: hypothetical protein A3G40_14960 [Deltaproteobacteria bacterium RIFCSPLOWO2_12_FULL_57_22]